jgi:hypothetical protein
MTATTKPEVNKKALYGRYQKSEDDRALFAKKVAYKAADMALDDEVNITSTKTGIGTAGAIGIGAAAGLPGIITALALIFGGKDAPAPQAPVQQAGPIDSEYEIRFFNDKGELIDVPRRPANTQ